MQVQLIVGLHRDDVNAKIIPESQSLLLHKAVNSTIGL